MRAGGGRRGGKINMTGETLSCLLVACLLLANTSDASSFHRHLLQADTTTPAVTTSTEATTSPAATATDSATTTPGPSVTEVSTTPGPSVTEGSTTPVPSVTEVSTTPGPSVTEVSTTPGPSVTEVSTTPVPTVSEVSTTPGPSVTEVSTTPVPTVSEVSTTPGPSVTEVSTTPGPTVTEVSTTPGPTVTEVSTTPGPTVTEVSTTPGPTVTEVTTTPGPTVTEVTTTPGPTVTNVTTTPGPTVTQAPNTTGSAVTPEVTTTTTAPPTTTTTTPPVVITTVPVPSVTTQRITLADLILSALLDCTEGDLDSRSGELESLLEQELDNLEQLQSESAQQLMLGIDDFIADEVTEGTANNILVACVVGKVFNEAESDDDVLVTLPPIFMSLEGLTPEDWNDGGRDTIRASLAAVLLGNPDLDQYIDVELVDEPDNKRKLLQATSTALVVRVTVRVPPALAADNQLPMYQDDFDQTWPSSVASELVSRDDTMFGDVSLTPTAPPVVRFVVFLEGVSMADWEDNGAGPEAFRVAAATVLTGEGANSDYIVVENAREMEEAMEGVAVAFRLEAPAILDTSSWPLYGDEDLGDYWALDLEAALKSESLAVFRELELVIAPGRTGDEFAESVMQNITNCESETGTILEVGLGDLDWEQVLIAVFMPGMQEVDLILTNYTVNSDVSAARIVHNFNNVLGSLQHQRPAEVPAHGNDGAGRKLQQEPPPDFKHTGAVLVLEALGINLWDLPRDFAGCVRGLASADEDETCVKLKEELDAGTITAEFCDDYFCDNPANHTFPAMDDTSGMNPYEYVSGDSCVECNMVVESLSAARDLGVLDEEEDFCRSDFDIDDLVFEVGRRACSEGEESCCVEAGVGGELYHPTGENGCPGPSLCGVAFECLPDMALLDSIEATPEMSTAVHHICSIIGGDSDRSCRSIRYDGEELCDGYSMCRLEGVAPMGDMCTAFGEWVTQCRTTNNGERAVLDCLTTACASAGGGSDVCTTWSGITNVLDAQYMAGWSFASLELDEVVMEVCRYGELQKVMPQLDTGLGEDCDDGLSSDDCPIFVPGNVLPDSNPLETRRCDPNVHCCVGSWQMGPNLCGNSRTCEFRGSASNGECIEIADCSTCDTCSAALAGLGASPVGAYLSACETIAAGVSQDTFCESFDWGEWLINAQQLSMEPNTLAACMRTRVCPELCETSLCPTSIVPDLPPGSCRVRSDCDTGNVCTPYDFTNPEMSCVSDTECDPETGFFNSQCLGVCQTQAVAACAAFREVQREAFFDVAASYETQLYETISAAYDAALENAEAGIEPSGLAEVYAEIESYADGLTTCVGDTDCDTGICMSDSRCNRLNYACNEEESVHFIDNDFQCTGFCVGGEQNNEVVVPASSLTATLSDDGSEIHIEFPSSLPDVNPFTVFSEQIFEDADEMLGTRSRISITDGDSYLTVTIGSRDPFNMNQPFQLTLLSGTTMETVGGRFLTFADDDLTFEVAYPSNPAPPMEPSLRYSTTWGASCGAGGSTAGSGKVTIEAVGDMWSEILWELESADSSEEQFQEYLDVVNGRADITDKLELSETELVSTVDADVLPAGDYVVSVTVTSLLGETAKVEASFTKESTPLPTVDFGASSINFTPGKTLLLSPIQSSLTCPGSFAYLWNVTSGDLILKETNTASIRIAPEQVDPGSTYEISLTIKDAGTGDELLVETVTVEVGISELQLRILGADSYRNGDEVTLTARLIDPDLSPGAVTYDWSCTSSLDAPCFTGSTVPEISDNTYAVEAGALVPGTYTFELTATKGDRSAEASIEVVIVDGTGNPPTGSITVVGWSEFPSRPVDSEATLKLSTDLSGTAVPAEDVAYEWLIDSAITQDGKLDTPFLIVSPSALTAGSSLTFSVRLTNTATSASFIANRTVAINSKPTCQRDSCVSVTPSEGFAHGETLFKVTTSGWDDEDILLNPNAQWMQYQFGYCHTYGCPTASSFLPIRTQTGSSFTFTTLPVGRAEDNKVTLQVCALDMHTASDSRLSRSCETKDVVVTEGDGGPDVDTAISLLTAPNSTVSAFERVLVGQSLVGRIVGQEGEENEESENEMNSLLQVFEDVSDDEDLPPESLGLLANAIVGAGGSGVGDEARSRGVRVLRNVANRLDDVEEGLDSLGESIMEGLGAMLGGLNGESEGGEEDTVDDVKDNLQEIFSKMGSRFLANLLSTEPFLTVGNARGANNTGAAMCVGKRELGDMDNLLVPLGGEDTRRRLLAGELTAGPSFSVKQGFAESCKNCASSLDIALTYIENAGYLLDGPDRSLFTDAIGEYLDRFDMSGVEVESVSGKVGVEISAGSSNNGSAVDLIVRMPVEASIYSTDGSAGLYCVMLGANLDDEPVVLHEASSPGADNLCECESDRAGDFVCVQAIFPAVPTPTPTITAPTPAPSPAATPLGTPVETVEPADSAIDRPPSVDYTVSFSVTFGADLNSIDIMHLSTALKATIAKEIDGVFARDVFVTGIKAGSVVVDVTIVAESEEEANGIADALKDKGVGLFVSMVEFGGISDLSDPIISTPDSDTPVGLIVGATIGSIAALAFVAALVFWLVRRRARVDNTISGPLLE